MIAIGGLDSSGGAGLVRDYLAGRALGADVWMLGTAMTLQLQGRATVIEPRAPDRLQQEVTVALTAAAGRSAAVKIGMVADPSQAAGLLAALATFGGPVVFDPVLASSAGAPLYRGDPAQLMPLLARATLVTPNLAEAAALTGAPVSGAEEARAAAQSLIRRGGARAVLVKGGHLAGDANDLLIWRPDPGHEPELFEWVFPAPRIPGASPRGTGCALATAIAVGLASGQPLAQAVLAAKTWLHGRIAAAQDLDGERLL